MIELTAEEMVAIDGGGWTVCGIAFGFMIGATVMYGGAGFAFTVNKAWVACTVPLVL